MQLRSSVKIVIFNALLCLSAASFAGLDKHLSSTHFENAFTNYKSLEGSKGCVKTQGWELKYIPFKRYLRTSVIRTGILRTRRAVVKGNLMYLEGLGDSMMNHAKLFKKLNNEGYNIISFDYMGQGCSSGTMNHTTITSIIKLSRKVWSTYVATNEQKNLIGWSTGGLAAYKFAKISPVEVNSIALIAPGIAPRILIGDNMQITPATLTQNNFSSENDPHIDAIKPISPLCVPMFALNLQGVAALARTWDISAKVAGYVFLSDENDTYVDPIKTIDVLASHASHFKYKFYQGTGALHELDNEIESVAGDLRQKMANFFNSVIK
jgi:pimeloyl-ACP methyl ester carboxylesterase